MIKHSLEKFVIRVLRDRKSIVDELTELGSYVKLVKVEDMGIAFHKQFNGKRFVSHSQYGRKLTISFIDSGVIIVIA